MRGFRFFMSVIAIIYNKWSFRPQLVENVLYV